MNTIEVMKQAMQAHKAMLEWIDAVPDDIVLPVMPGFDRDWADTVGANLEQAIKQEEQQPVPVKTYSGGKAWPVQTDWVGLTDDEVKYFQMVKNVYPGITKEIEAKLKEKNSKG
jgi:hypothetical protein